jgi:hypothetical protein
VLLPVDPSDPEILDGVLVPDTAHEDTLQWKVVRRGQLAGEAHRHARCGMLKRRWKLEGSGGLIQRKEERKAPRLRVGRRRALPPAQPQARLVGCSGNYVVAAR